MKSYLTGLMPNHFHLMVLVNGGKTEGFAQSEALGGGQSKALGGGGEQSLNHSIGILLRSYTNAINKRFNRSGSLFRKNTKAECINCHNGITPSFYKTEFGTQMHVSNSQKTYLQACFNYIHQNLVKAGLVDKPENWEFSSAIDYADLRGGTLVNKIVAQRYVKF